MLKLCCLSGLKRKLNSVLAVHEDCCLLVFRRVRLLSRVLYNSSLFLYYSFSFHSIHGTEATYNSDFSHILFHTKHHPFNKSRALSLINFFRSV